MGTAGISPRVTDFVANFQGGGARPNLYNVIMTFPFGTTANTTATKLSYTCRTASLPSSNMGIAMVPYMGRQVKIAGDKVFDDWTITVVNDADFVVRDAFERWLDRINGHMSNIAARGWSNPLNYLARAEIIQLDREDRDLKKYTMEGIFPTSVSEIQMGYDQNDMVEEFSVTLAVNYWSSDTTT